MQSYIKGIPSDWQLTDGQTYPQHVMHWAASWYQAPNPSSKGLWQGSANGCMLPEVQDPWQVTHGIVIRTLVWFTENRKQTQIVLGKDFLMNRMRSHGQVEKADPKKTMLHRWLWLMHEFHHTLTIMKRRTWIMNALIEAAQVITWG